MSTGRAPIWAGAVLGAVLAGGAALAVVDGGRGGEGSSLPTVTVKVHHSRFVPERIKVEPGTEVRFVLENTDPIAHEFIVGPQAVHDRHEKGTEKEHSTVPGEVSFQAHETAETTFRFDRPGEVLFACHLPGHFDYGMKGVIEVE